MKFRFTRKIVAFTLAAAILALPLSTASAQQYAKKTVINFDDDTIEGDLNRPDGDYLDAMKSRKYQSLIKIRTNFKTEILQSVRKL
jgi:hypothetical protein